jgi:hypothetical protein
MKPARIRGQRSLVGNFEVSNCYVDRAWWLKLGSLLTNRMTEYLNTAYFGRIHLRVFAYCLHNRFVTNEQHSGDFFKLKNLLHCARIFGLYGSCYRITAQRKSCIFVYPRQFVHETNNGAFEDLIQFLLSVV